MQLYAPRKCVIHTSRQHLHHLQQEPSNIDRILCEPGVQNGSTQLVFKNVDLHQRVRQTGTRATGIVTTVTLNIRHPYKSMEFIKKVCPAVSHSGTVFHITKIDKTTLDQGCNALVTWLTLVFIHSCRLRSTGVEASISGPRVSNSASRDIMREVFRCSHLQFRIVCFLNSWPSTRRYLYPILRPSCPAHRFLTVFVQVVRWYDDPFVVSLEFRIHKRSCDVFASIIAHGSSVVSVLSPVLLFQHRPSAVTMMNVHR